MDGIVGMRMRRLDGHLLSLLTATEGGIQQLVRLFFLSHLLRLLIDVVLHVGGLFLHHFHNCIGNVHSTRHRCHRQHHATNERHKNYLS